MNKIEQQILHTPGLGHKLIRVIIGLSAGQSAIIKNKENDIKVTVLHQRSLR